MNTSHNVLFVPHGAPTFALRPGAVGAAMSRVAQQLQTPRAIIVVSPHWETAQPTVGTATKLETIHDFYGFDPALYSLSYPATGCPEAAREVVKALQAHGLSVAEDDRRGLDHGAWAPLRQMFPDADIPVVPVSVQSHAGPAHALRVGQALRDLVTQGFLLIASGNITHNLGDWRVAHQTGGSTPAYVNRFADWIHEQLLRHDVDALLDYRCQSADGVRAHPSDEHLLPLFTALGAAGEAAQAQPFYRGVSDYVIAMDGYQFIERA
ncbi:MAG: hypothetical protein RLY90_726 [Pseudomonadota bacterium]|jgi:4,5-DOPA dioxygenase extradiol